MATYYDISGQKVQYLSSDPSPITKGQVWYNSTSNSLKMRTYNAAVWTSGATTPYAARGAQGFADSKNAAQIFGGYTTGATSTSVEYDGSTWTATPGLNTPTYSGSGGIGVKASAITVGGQGQNSEQWNGSSWSNITTFPNSPNSVEGTGGFGSTTAGYFMGGSSPTPTAPTVKPSTTTWNGTAWTTLNPMAIGRTAMGACGISTAAIVFGGESGVPPSYPGVRNQQEDWDGTSWTASPVTLNTPRYAFASCQNGPAATAWAGGGYTPAITETWKSTEEYDGTTWANSSAVVTYEARGGQGSGGIQGASGFMANGTYPGNPTFNTDGCSEFDPGSIATQTVTTS